MGAREHCCKLYRESFKESLLKISNKELTEEDATRLAKERCHPEILMARGMPLSEEGAKLLARKVAFEMDLY